MSVFFGCITTVVGTREALHIQPAGNRTLIRTVVAQKLASQVIALQLMQNRLNYSFAASFQPSRPLSSTNCLPFVHPVQIASVSSPPSPAFKPRGAQPLPSTPIPCPTAAGLESSPSCIANPGDDFNVTAGRWSKPRASNSGCVNTGVQQASVPSKMASQSSRVFSLKTAVKKSFSFGQSALSSRLPGRLDGSSLSPLSSAAQN